MRTARHAAAIPEVWQSVWGAPWHSQPAVFVGCASTRLPKRDRHGKHVPWKPDRDAQPLVGDALVRHVAETVLGGVVSVYPADRGAAYMVGIGPEGALVLTADDYAEGVQWMKQRLEEQIEAVKAWAKHQEKAQETAELERLGRESGWL